MTFSASRTELLLGRRASAVLEEKRVILFGTGGVGSWCAESLVRTGVGRMTLVDGDIVEPSNVNRQVMATSRTIGRVKVEVMRERLLEINPEAEIEAVHAVYTRETDPEYDFGRYDYVIDCIDSLRDKAYLLYSASASEARVFSSMGAALKADPLGVRTAEFWKVRDCPLAAALRKRMRREGLVTAKPVECVYSGERLRNAEDAAGECGGANGSLVHVTAVFGFVLASLVVKDAVEGGKNGKR